MRRVCFLVLAACGGGSDANDAMPMPMPMPDATVDSDPYCHYDCFGSVSCTGNEVRYQLHAPVPCAHWTGECPYTIYTCTDGCDVAFDFFSAFVSDEARLSAFCAEASPVS